MIDPESGYDPEKPVDVLLDPDDYESMPDHQLLLRADDPLALIELHRRFPEAL